MKVIVPHGITNIGKGDGLDDAPLRWVRLNLEIQGVEAIFEPMETDRSYPELFRRLWAEGEPFVIVEHDILPWPGAIAELDDDGAWCGFCYAVPGGLDAFLGCTKIDPSAIDFPAALELESATYQHCDIEIAGAFQRAGVFMHHHGPPVVHLHAGYDGSKHRDGTYRLACGCTGEEIGGHAYYLEGAPIA